MNVFKKFGDYMFYLLTTPLKKNRDRNQFYLFFKVIGKIFDKTKQDIFKVRTESSIATASELMLMVHGQDRDMARYDGETVEAYRNRLLMNAVIAEWAGSAKGILYALESVGYPNCEIEPLWKTIPERWAEFYVIFHYDLEEENTINFKCVKREVMNTKQASALPNFRFRYHTIIKNNTEVIRCVKITNRMALEFWSFYSVMLNGGFLLDGTQLLDSSIDLYQTNIVNRVVLFNNTERIENETIIIRNNLWYLDGEFCLDGSKKISAYIREEAL